MDLMLFCKGMVNTELSLGWAESDGGRSMELCLPPFHHPLLEEPLLLGVLPVL